MNTQIVRVVFMFFIQMRCFADYTVDALQKIIPSADKWTTSAQKETCIDAVKYIIYQWDSNIKYTASDI